MEVIMMVEKRRRRRDEREEEEEEEKEKLIESYLCRLACEARDLHLAVSASALGAVSRVNPPVARYLSMVRPHVSFGCHLFFFP